MGDLLHQVFAEPSHAVLTVLLVLLVAWFVHYLLGNRKKNLPPGPKGLPLLGQAWTIMRAMPDIRELYSSWSNEYGDIIHFTAGPVRFVVLSSYKAISDAFQNPALNDRPQSQLIKEVLGMGNNGISLAIGDTWKEQRNFTHSVFRSLGVGRKSYEDGVIAEAEQLIAAMEETKGAPFDPKVLLQRAVSNIICTIVFGTQYKYTDSQFLRILDLMNTNMKLSSAGGALLFLPLPGISKIPFGAPKQIAKNMREYNEFVMDIITSHEKDFDPDDPRDFIDLYLKKMAETKDRGTSFCFINLYSCISDLFFAGTDTTSTTLDWGLLYMIAYPTVQSRLQAELDHVVGRDRLPCLEDRNKLPYTNAVLLEIQRISCVAPFGLPHIAAADTELHGYTIPKGSALISNIWEVLHSEALWGDPGTFRPERFLSSDGQLKKREEMIIFSTGRRVCVGERLARMELFLFFASLLHRFTFQKPRDAPPTSFGGTFGITWRSNPYDACAVRRD